MTQQDELQKLRTLVQKQQEELKQKDELIARKDETIARQDETIRKQNIQIENMMQALLHARKKLFGKSSEASQISGQLSLFDTTEELASGLLKEQKAVTVSSNKRTPRQEGVRKEMLACLPKEIEEYIINEEDTCTVCGGELKVIGKEIVRTEVEFQQAKVIVKQIVRQVAKCSVCGSKDGENPNSHFQKAAVPAKVLQHSIATPSLVAQVMYQKYAMGIPLNR